MRLGESTAGVDVVMKRNYAKDEGDRMKVPQSLTNYFTDEHVTNIN